MATGERTRMGLDWKAAAWAGIIAGLVFLVLEMILVPMFMGGSPWGPPRMIAAIVLGREVLPPPDTFDAGIVAMAMVVHFTLSIVYAIILAALVPGATQGRAIGVGAVFGLVLYLVNFYLFTGIFPWFAMARHWVSVFSHIVFGLVTGYAYVALRGPAPDAAAGLAHRAGRRWDGVDRRVGLGGWSGPERRRA